MPPLVGSLARLTPFEPNISVTQYQINILVCKYNFEWFEASDKSSKDLQREEQK